jgi:uncharacterized repeat protein (TIGR03803 family)
MLRSAHRFVPILILAPVALVALAGAATRVPSSTPAVRPMAALHQSQRRPDGESVLYAFQSGSDGALPYAGLVADSHGALYGTTLHGGGPSGGYGTVFKLTPGASGYTESILWTFAGYPNDGQWPYGGLIVDKNGALYGVTYAGGSAGQGSVFKLAPKGSRYAESVLYSFQGGNTDGGNPYGGLYMDSNGSLYGTTQYGGGPSSGFGTVFKLAHTRSGYTESVIHAFQGGNDGASPYAALIGDAHGALYGTTADGGSVQNWGSVFELTPAGSIYQETILYNFPYPGGSHPLGGLIRDSQGALYGTTTEGGPNNAGAVFKLAPSGSGYTESTLYTFVGCNPSSPSCDGAEPAASLYMDGTCTLYGTTQYGGTDGLGTVFELSPAVRVVHAGVCAAGGGVYTESLLHAFLGGSDGKNPEASLIEQGGVLYSTTFYGGSTGNGTVFSINP